MRFTPLHTLHLEQESFHLWCISTYIDSFFSEQVKRNTTYVLLNWAVHERARRHQHQVSIGIASDKLMCHDNKHLSGWVWTTIHCSDTLYPHPPQPCPTHLTWWNGSSLQLPIVSKTGTDITHTARLYECTCFALYSPFKVAEGSSSWSSQLPLTILNIDSRYDKGLSG